MLLYIPLSLIEKCVLFQKVLIDGGGGDNGGFLSVLILADFKMAVQLEFGSSFGSEFGLTAELRLDCSFEIESRGSSCPRLFRRVYVFLNRPGFAALPINDAKLCSVHVKHKINDRIDIYLVLLGWM